MGLFKTIWDYNKKFPLIILYFFIFLWMALGNTALSIDKYLRVVTTFLKNAFIMLQNTE